MPRYKFNAEYTVEAESEEEARKEFQKRLDSVHLKFNENRFWDAKRNNLYHGCYKANVVWGEPCPKCGRLNDQD